MCALQLTFGLPSAQHKDKTTPPPAVAPTAVATSTVRIVRKKLGAGARQPHSG